MKKRTSNTTLGQSPDMFKHAWMNKLTRTHIAFPVTIFLLYAIGLLYFAGMYTTLSTGLIVGLFFGGVLLFTFAEYSVHRWAYHPPENASERFQKFTYTVHGIHHDYPKDKQRLALPPWLSVIVATALLGVFKLVLDQYSFATLAGFLAGYALYLLIHYSVHIYRPPNNAFRALWTNHAIHHYSEDEILFGVSSPLWDHVFGTMPKQKDERRQVKVEVK